MSVDTAKLTLLQRKFASSALETCPEGVSQFTVVATSTGSSMSYKLKARPPFMLNDEAEATLREIFLLYQSGGDPLRGLTCEFEDKPDRGWSMAMEYDYP